MFVLDIGAFLRTAIYFTLSMCVLKVPATILVCVGLCCIQHMHNSTVELQSQPACS